jgi:hypothetical protein
MLDLQVGAHQFGNRPRRMSLGPGHPPWLGPLFDQGWALRSVEAPVVAIAMVAILGG